MTDAGKPPASPDGRSLKSSSARARGLSTNTLAVCTRGRTHGNRARPRCVHAPPGRREYLVVRSVQIIASDPEEADALFEPARDKVYRHPSFYVIPDEVKNL